MSHAGSDFNNRSNCSYLSTVITTGLVAVPLYVGAANLPGREHLYLENLSNKRIYVGPLGVTTSGATRGIKLGSGDDIILPFGDKIMVYAICATAAKDLLVQEF